MGALGNPVGKRSHHTSLSHAVRDSRCDPGNERNGLISSLEKLRGDFRSEEDEDNASENSSLVDGLGSETLTPEHVYGTLLAV